MKKPLFLFIFSLVFLYPCFSQNMLVFGGQYNFSKPEFWNAGVGFNMKLINEYFQNDLMLNFGSFRNEVIVSEEQGEDTIRVNTGEYKENYLYTVKDSFYFTLDGSWIGLRAGVFAGFGIYGVIEFPKVYDLFFNPGGLVGICLFPKSLFSLALDFSPGYVVAFRLGNGLYINESNLSLSLSLGLRLNFDRI